MKRATASININNKDALSFAYVEAHQAEAVQQRYVVVCLFVFFVLFGDDKKPSTH